MATSHGQPPNEYWDSRPHQFAYQSCKVGQDRSRIFWNIWRDMPIFAVSQKRFSLLTAKSLRLLNWISPNFYRICTNDCRLLFKNKNCDLPILFGTPRWRMKIVIKLRPNLSENCAFNSVSSEIIGQICTRCSRIIAIKSFESQFTIGQSVVERRSKE